jgi:O-methyltransferase
MPRAIHIVIVVYGKAFTDLLAEITLANLAALVREIPADIRGRSVVRILTRMEDMRVIERSPALRPLRAEIQVQILNALQSAEFEKHGGYGPMVATQRQAVIEAARAGAAIFFVGPDQIYNRGAFAFFLGRLKEGYRAIIGPGLRIRRDAARRVIEAQIQSSTDGTFALTADQQVELLFRYSHPINEQFVMGSGKDIWWKAYIYYRPHPDELFIRFFQGPTLVAWPPGPLEDFDGFIDHQLAMRCCASSADVFVIPDSSDCLALDMTDDLRVDVYELSQFPRALLLRQFATRGTMNEIQLQYGLRTCRVHYGERPAEDVLRWQRTFAAAINPLIALAIAERKVAAKLGRTPAKIFLLFALSTLSLLSALLNTMGLIRFLRRYERLGDRTLVDLAERGADEELRRLAAKDTKPLRDAASELLLEGKENAALLLRRVAVEALPDDPVLHFEYLRNLFDLGRQQEALEAAKRFHTSAKIFRDLASGFLSEGKEDLAVFCRQIAVQAAPTEPVVHQELLRTLVALGRHEAALVASEKLDLSQPGTPRYDFSAHEKVIYSVVGDLAIASPELIAALVRASDYVLDAKIPGAFVECGVFRGGSALAMMMALQYRQCENREFYLYDTFAGMPLPEPIDVYHDGRPALEEWQEKKSMDGRSGWVVSTLEETRSVVLRSGYPANNVHLVEGMVESTIPSVVPPEIALLRLDTDFYRSTKHELEHLYPRLQPGGILIIDDYGAFKGSRAAVDEYFGSAERPIFLGRVDANVRIAVKPR